MDAGLVYTMAMLFIGATLLNMYGMSGVGDVPPTRNGRMVLRYNRGFVYFCHFVLIMVSLWTLGLAKMIADDRTIRDVLIAMSLWMMAVVFCVLCYRGYYRVEVEFDETGVWKHGQFGEQYVAWKDVTKLSTTRGIGSLSLYTAEQSLHVSQYSSGLGTFAGYVRRFVPEIAQQDYVDLLYQLEQKTSQK